MAAKQSRSVPGELARARERFHAWRRTKRAGARIPEPLWKLAVQLAQKHSLNRTASALGLDYYSLRRRVESSEAAPRSSAPTSAAFVELPAAAFPTGECLIELDDGVGGSLRMRLTGYDAADLAKLGRSLWRSH